MPPSSNAVDVTAQTPFVSVIIPVHNDPEGISLTLESVTNQTYPTEQYEIIVADNDSTDDTCGVVQSYVKRYPELVSLVVENETQSPAAARNKGVENASGSTFVFIDADMTVDEAWLESVVESLQKGDHDYMGCTVETYTQEGRETLAAKYDRLFAFPMEEYLRKSNYVGTGCLAVRRYVFDDIGLFNSELISSEDKEFGQRVHEAGYDLHFEPSIMMYHPARSSLFEQISKGFRLGRGKRQLYAFYPERFGTGNVFRLRSYLPLNPLWFYSQVKDEEDISSQDMIGLYIVGSLQKIARAAGTLYEYSRDTSANPDR